MTNFIKKNNSRFPDALIKEAQGLELLRKLCNHDLICIPEVVYVDQEQLVLTMINNKECSSKLAERLGQGLAELHEIEHPRYGFDKNNYIGLNPQINSWFNDWGEFFVSKRLRYQIELIENPGVREEFIKVLDQKKSTLNSFLNEHCSHASLVHGDLWSGNYMCDGENVWLIDPAVYFADREVDVAMTEMFGGFSSSFYNAYEACFPLTDVYPVKKQVFNLYHYLNHYNLFGDGYLDSCRHGLAVIEGL